MSRSITAVLLTVFAGPCAEPPASTGSSSLEPWVPPDTSELVPLEPLFAALEGEDLAARAEAKVWLARIGPRALRELDRRLVSSSGEDRDEMIGIVAGSYGWRVPIEVFDRMPRLAAIVEPEVEAAREIAQPLFEAKRFHTTDIPEVRECLLALARRGPFVFPVIEELLDHRDNPIARAYGIMLAQRSGAKHFEPRLRALTSDDARLTKRGDDWVQTVTIGMEASAALHSLEEHYRYRASLGIYLEVESFLGASGASMDVNDLRATGAWQAESWEDWWWRARPAWRAWWAMTPEQRQSSWVGRTYAYVREGTAPPSKWKLDPLYPTRPRARHVGARSVDPADPSRPR